MDIRFSRHAKRRMALYGLEESDVLLAIEKGEKQVLLDGKLCFIFKIDDKFKYPLKVVAVEKTDSLTIVTTYPLKKAR
jgi:hypothetical protein